MAENLRTTKTMVGNHTIPPGATIPDDNPLTDLEWLERGPVMVEDTYPSWSEDPWDYGWGTWALYGVDSAGDLSDDAISHLERCGLLYNWWTTDDEPNYQHRLCPSGWRVPSTADWSELFEYVGPNAGGKLKSTSPDCWDSPNTGATDEFGFHACGCGYRSGAPSRSPWSNDGGFFHDRMYGWWLSSDIDVHYAFWTDNMTTWSGMYQNDHARMFYNDDQAHSDHDWPATGMSVRCIKN